MDKETDAVISFESHESESFTLLKFGQIFMCQNQKLQIPIFMLYKAPVMELTKSNIIVLWWKAVVKSLMIQNRNFFSLPFTSQYFVSQVVARMPWTVYLTYGFMFQFILYIILSSFIIFLPIWFSNENHLRYHVIYVTIRFRENTEGFKRLSWLIMCGGNACVRNDTVKGRLSFLQLFLKLIPLVK